MDERVKWDDLSPEERDRLVAEKVTGWQRFQDCDATEDDIVLVGEYSYCLRCRRIEYQMLLDHSQGSLPRYSQSMDAAWQVLKKMLDMQTDSEHPGELTPQFEEFSDLLFDGWTSASTHGDIYPGYRIIEIAAAWTPESICKAALRAMGVEIDDK